ncbi:hypothetical protein NP174_22770, partial [Salmonella enterica]|nr:hypothetical protein [Salmonella enterica]
YGYDWTVEDFSKIRNLTREYRKLWSAYCSVNEVNATCIDLRSVLWEKPRQYLNEQIGRLRAKRSYYYITPETAATLTTGLYDKYIPPFLSFCNATFASGGWGSAKMTFFNFPL